MRRNRGINGEALAQAGVDTVVINTLQQLARLDLLDRAAREGCSSTERLGNELDQLRESVPDLQPIAIASDEFLIYWRHASSFQLALL